MLRGLGWRWCRRVERERTGVWVGGLCLACRGLALALALAVTATVGRFTACED